MSSLDQCRYAIGLGSNLGDRLSYLRRAAESLHAFTPLLARSPIYETAPVGGPEGQGPYLNAVVIVKHAFPPHDLFQTMMGIEKQLGRIRKERNGPRTIDLDLVWSERPYRTDAHDNAEIVVPHPRARERLFVVRPLLDIWPGLDLPIPEGAVRRIRDTLDLP